MYVCIYIYIFKNKLKAGNLLGQNNFKLQKPIPFTADLSFKIVLNLQMTYIIIAPTYEQWDS